MQSGAERLRNSLLSAISHDLRTPLASLVGLAESLAMVQPPLPAHYKLGISSVRLILRRQAAMPMLMRVPEDSWVSTI